MAGGVLDGGNDAGLAGSAGSMEAGSDASTAEPDASLEGGSDGSSDAGAPEAGPDAGQPCPNGVIEVSALIDGRDRLSITPERMTWQHGTYAAPGLIGNAALPTEVSVTLGSVTSSLAWCPIWSNGCETCDGSCGELRSPDTSQALLAASFLQGEGRRFFPGSVLNPEFTCSGGEGRPGASCSLLQAPTLANGDTAIIEFDDDIAPGPSQYTARLSFDSSACADAGMDGGAGDGGTDAAAADAGMDAAAGDAGPGVLSVSPAEIDFLDRCPPPQSLTLTNTGASPLTWSATFQDAIGSATFRIDPDHSTLGPQASITVTVSSDHLGFAHGPDTSIAELVVDTDAPGEPMHSVHVVDLLTLGVVTGAPPSLDFGEVPIGSSVPSGFIPNYWSWSFPLQVDLASSDPNFGVDSLARGNFDQHGWIVTFTPQSPGLHTGTLVYTEQSCSPETSTVTGVGFYDTTCTLVYPEAPCGERSRCGVLGCSPLRHALASGPITVQRGVLFEFLELAEFEPWDYSAPFSANVDWGDGTQPESANVVPPSVYGTHTYSDLGTFTGTITLFFSDDPEHSIGSATFVASVEE